MSTSNLCQQIKKSIDSVPRKRLESLAEYLRFLNQPTITQRLSAAKKAIAAGKGMNWRKVRSDV